VQTKTFVSLTGANQIDRLFHEKNQDSVNWVDFAFDEQVVKVFPDMISRSVPRYWEVNQQTALWAKKFYQKGSNIYDLGASLGAVSWEVAQQLLPESPSIIAIEQSSAMVEQFRRNLKENPMSNIEIWEQDVCQARLENASVIICNYTLQFVCPSLREKLLLRMYEALRPNGVLLLAEKIAMDSPEIEQEIQKLHQAWKQEQGYSLNEVQKKSRAIANVMPVDEISVHQERLRSIGFSSVTQWSQQYNFMALVAQK
jgi:tRNA (cmo5U34)-methyltransferase